MHSLEEKLTEQFHAWEMRGRGWRIWNAPVSPEPPFRPFYGHFIKEEQTIDDGRRPTAISSFLQKFSKSLGGTVENPEAPASEEPEPEPDLLEREPLIELRASLPASLSIPKETFEQFLTSLSLCHEPVGFEILGTPKKVMAQFTAGAIDASLVRRQLQAHFHEAVFQTCEGTLRQSWVACEGEEALVVEFGLSKEFMLPLASGKLDPFIGIIGALSELKESELGLFQVLFRAVHNDWAESITRSVTYTDGKPFFVNEPGLAHAAENKISRPLYAAVVRIAVKAESFERTLQIARDLAGSLRIFAHPRGNEIIPLKNDEYPFSDHIEDVLCRQSRRSGMLLNSDELTGFVHLPSSAVRVPAFERDSGKSKPAPSIVQNASGLLLGENVHFGETIALRLTPEQRVYHTHIIGATGTGKSTLLFNLIRQDIENGQGVAVLDPHGDLVDKILGIIPANRIHDAILVDPSDEEFAVGFNILSAHSDHEKTLLSSDLVSVFQRLSTSWGDQMQSVLQNAILAFLNSSRSGTLADLRRFLVEPAFRTEFLKSVSDPNVLYYWHKGFSHLSGNKSIGPILTRLEMFLAQRPIALMVSQQENKLDFGQIMDSGKIFLAKLPEGLLGRENSYLLGALLVSKFQQLVMARQAKKIAMRRDFWIYIDEFANFITPTMAEILSGARKYRIGLTLAHHELHQLQRSPYVASAVMTHPFTRIVFRVGDDDAKKLAEGFSHFQASDLKNLEVGEAICRVERSNFDFNLSVLLPEPIDEVGAATRQQEVVTASRERYSTPRAEVEALLRKAWEVEIQKPPLAKTEPARAAPKARTSPLQSIVEPNIAQVPVTTVSEKEKAVTVEAKQPPQLVVEVQKQPPVRDSQPPRDLGKGGAQHQAIQKRIKEAAEALGFRSVIEKQIGGGQESVDLLLERAGQSIACEISITTTIDHEVGNVAKCLKASFTRVVVICLEDERLRKIRVAVSGSLGLEMSARVEYHQPDSFIASLKALPPPVPKDSETIRHGYKVKRSVPKLTLEEQKQKEDIANRILAEAMRRK